MNVECTAFEVFGRPFDANSVYTLGQPDPRLAAELSRFQQSAYVYLITLSARRGPMPTSRPSVPLLIGETGELTNAWNEKFRLLHERFGIGWCFWPYKNLDSDSAVVSIAKPAGWDLIASVGSADVPLSPRLGRLTLSLSQGRETHSNNA